MSTQLSQRASFIYLAMVPFITAAIGFGIGGYSNAINIPVWIIHSILMVFLFWKISGHLQEGNSGNGPKWIAAAALLFVPWVLFTLFAGFGPPPSSAEKWVASATQQQVRYSILAAGGIIAAIGFALLSQQLTKASPVNNYAKAAIVLVYIATPLYVLNMLYWGFYLTESFRFFTSNGITDRPEWYLAARELFYWVATIALSLSYLSTALFAAALKKAGVFKPGACNAYIIISMIAFICSFIMPPAPTPLDIIGYFVAIPAISFIMPYLMALNLARVGWK